MKLVVGRISIESIRDNRDVRDPSYRTIREEGEAKRGQKWGEHGTVVRGATPPLGVSSSRRYTAFTAGQPVSAQQHSLSSLGAPLGRLGQPVPRDRVTFTVCYAYETSTTRNVRVPRLVTAPPLHIART